MLLAKVILLRLFIRFTTKMVQPTPLPAAPQTPPPFDEEKMQLLMSQLQQLEASQGISAWPPAIGWWLVTIFAIALLALIIISVTKQFKIKRIQKLLLNEYEQIATDYQHDKDSSKYLKALNQLLRRSLFIYTQRDTTATLQNDNWLQVLKFSNVDIPQPVEHALCIACYQPQPDIEFDALDHFAQNWLAIQKPSLYKHWNKETKGA